MTPGRRKVHLADFAATALVTEQKRIMRKLVLLKVTAFIVNHFPTVTAISFSLNNRDDGPGDSMELAGARATLLHSIGADQITVRPDFEPLHGGQFVIDGVWIRTRQSLEALMAALHLEREVYGTRKAAGTRRGLLSLGARIRRLVSGADT